MAAHTLDSVRSDSAGPIQYLLSL